VMLPLMIRHRMAQPDDEPLVDQEGA